MASIETELMKMSGVKTKKGEKRDAFLARLVDKVQTIADSDEAKWEALSRDAQLWVNKATDAVKGEEPIDDFESEDESEPDEADEETEIEVAGDDEEDEDEKEEEDETEDEAEEKKVSTKPVKKAKAPAKASAKKAAAKEEKKKPEKKTAEKAPKASTAPKDTGVKVRIKKLLIKKPSMTVDDLMTKLEGSPNGAPSRLTVAGIRAEFRHSLHVLKGEGLLEIEI